MITQFGWNYKNESFRRYSGGISNGMDIFFRVAFKPVATIMQKQESLDNQGNITEMTGKGRHDPCVVPRAVLSLKQWLRLY
jgi:chorismate synthase